MKKYISVLLVFGMALVVYFGYKFNTNGVLVFKQSMIAKKNDVTVTINHHEVTHDANDNKTIEASVVYPRQGELKDNAVSIISLKGNTVIVPLSGIVLQEDTNEIAKKIGMSKISRYTLSHWKNPGDVLFSTLGSIALDLDPTPETVQPLMYNGYQMPYSFIELQVGKITHEVLQNRLTEFFNQRYENGFFKSALEHEIVSDIIHTTLNPSSFVDISKVNNDIVGLLVTLKENGYHLLLATNTSFELFGAIKESYPELIELFDGILISAEAGILKNDPAFFKILQERYQLDIPQCLFIDADQRSLEIAEQYGMQTIPFTNYKNLKSTLKKMGVL